MNIFEQQAKNMIKGFAIALVIVLFVAGGVRCMTV